MGLFGILKASKHLSAPLPSSPTIHLDALGHVQLSSRMLLFDSQQMKCLNYKPIKWRACNGNASRCLIRAVSLLIDDLIFIFRHECNLKVWRKQINWNLMRNPCWYMVTGSLL